MKKDLSSLTVREMFEVMVPYFKEGPGGWLHGLVDDAPEEIVALYKRFYAVKGPGGLEEQTGISFD